MERVELSFTLSIDNFDGNLVVSARSALSVPFHTKNYPLRIQPFMQKDICSKMFTAVFVIAKTKTKNKKTAKQSNVL